MAALRKLDRTGSRESRLRRKAYKSNLQSLPVHGDLQDIFFPDEYYDFDEGHYDGVIHHYREMHLTSWPNGIGGLESVVNKLHSICPTQNIQTHLLHLASHGRILPHIDNVSASGSWILGVSLGAERILRMESPVGHDNDFDVILPSGSIYLQRNSMRFTYKHSILEETSSAKCAGQRLSIMIRDLPSRDAISL